MERHLIERAAELAGLRLDPQTDVTITGNDPVLPTPLHLGEGAAVALGLVGQEVDAIWQLRGGERQALHVDVAHAAASLHSFAVLRIDGVAPTHIPRAGMQITAIFECRDGRYIHLHASFGHAPGTLEVLGLPLDASVDAIAAATEQWDAFELEDALAARGLCAAVCRTAEEWAQHPQGQALASLPVVEVIRIGDAPPEPMPRVIAGSRPLDGLRVLDLTRVLAGPTVARTLAEHGADVLHVASPALETVPLFELDTGHGKRQAFLDLDDASDADRLRALLRDADVFSQGFQLGSLDRRGFGPEQVAAMRPGIVYVSENAFGHVGPWATRPGWEQLGQAATGVTVVQGEHTNGGRPTLAPAAINDYTTGYFAALGTLMALRRRAVEGGSWLVRTSLSQTSMWYLRLGQELAPAEARGLGEVASFTETCETTYGSMTRLRPALQMSATPPHWAIPTAPLGSGTATWDVPAR